MGPEHGEQPAHSVHRLSGRRAHQDRAGRRQQHQRVVPRRHQYLLLHPWGRPRWGHTTSARPTGAAKAGLEQLTRRLAVELGPHKHSLQRLETTASGCTADFRSQRPDVRLGHLDHLGRLGHLGQPGGYGGSDRPPGCTGRRWPDGRHPSRRGAVTAARVGAAY